MAQVEKSLIGGRPVPSEKSILLTLIRAIGRANKQRLDRVRQQLGMFLPLVKNPFEELKKSSLKT
jgi:hypothetical protein